MPFVSHETLLRFRHADLEKSTVLASLAKEISDDSGAHANPEMLLNWIPQLPPRKKLKKIWYAFHRIAGKRGVTIHHLTWWTMAMKGHRHIRLDIQYANGTRLHVILTYKRRRRAHGEAPKIPPFPGGSGWGWDPEAPGGWHYDLEADVYRDAKKLLKKFLDRHALPRLPSGAARRDFVEPLQ